MLVEGLFGCVPLSESGLQDSLGWSLLLLLEEEGAWAPSHVSHMRCEMGSGRWKEADSEAIAHSGSS